MARNHLLVNSAVTFGAGAGVTWLRRIEVADRGRRRWRVRVDDKGDVMVVREGGPRSYRAGATSEAVLVVALVLPMLATGVWLTWGSLWAVIA